MPLLAFTKKTQGDSPLSRTGNSDVHLEIEELLGLSERKKTNQHTRHGSNEVVPSFSVEEFKADSDLLLSGLDSGHFKSGSDLMLMDDDQNDYDARLLDMLDRDSPTPKSNFNPLKQSRNERLPAFGPPEKLDPSPEDLNFFSQSTFGRVGSESPSKIIDTTEDFSAVETEQPIENLKIAQYKLSTIEED